MILNISSQSWERSTNGDIIWVFERVRGWPSIAGPYCILDLEKRIVSEVGKNKEYSLPYELKIVTLSEEKSDEK